MDPTVRFTLNFVYQELANKSITALAYLIDRVVALFGIPLDHRQ